NINEETIVVGRVGYYCGSIHLTEPAAWVTDNAFVTTYPKEYIFRDWLIWLLKGTNLKKNDNATAQPVISGKKIYPIVVGLPPLKEQKRIHKKLNQLMQSCEELERNIMQRKNTDKLLMKCILNTAI
ncbi:MAG: restriction endonuclease subunit S, partial [Halanaerobiales bacterium]